jgi:hypothetical protein
LPEQEKMLYSFSLLVRFPPKSDNHTSNIPFRLCVNEPGVTQVYDRYSYDRDKGEALEAWGNRIEAILSEDKAA